MMMGEPSQAHSACELRSLHQLRPAYNFHRSDISCKQPPESSGRETLHTHTNTHSRADVYPCRQPVETDSLRLSSSSPPPVRQDGPHLPYNICYAQESPFSNIFSLLAEKGSQRFLESKRCFLTRNPSPSPLHVCQPSQNSSWIEGGRGRTHACTRDAHTGRNVCIQM